MTSTDMQRAVHRSAERARSTARTDVARMREDAAITRVALARSAVVDPSFLRRIELGIARPSLETYTRLAAELGADLSVRLSPNTGPAIRDRHQAAILECLLGTLHPRWHAYRKSPCDVRREAGSTSGCTTHGAASSWPPRSNPTCGALNS